MTSTEFSEEFDILYDNINSNAAPGLNSYEKSVFLTKAQEDIIKGILSSVEENELLRRYLDPLIKTSKLTINRSSAGIASYLNKYYVYKVTLPTDCWYIIYEMTKRENSNCNTIITDVIPVRHDELSRLLRNPFKKPKLGRTYRLDVEDGLELISSDVVTEYTIRYIIKPTPIILEDLTGSYTIDGITNQTDCILPESLHRTVLEAAVNMAVQHYKQRE